MNNNLKEVLNLKKRLLSLLLCIALVFSAAAIPTVAYAAEDENTEYEIYPVPQSVEYQSGSVALPESVKLELSDSLDEYTVDKAHAVLDENNIAYGESGSFVLSVSVKDDNVSGAPQPTDAELFDKISAYILTIDNNKISIVGKDTDAAFYGLVTLKWILNQCTDSVRKLRIEDYADSRARGFIEGYYGYPWSDADRISLMTFGGDFKATSYIFSPKDDPKHNSSWRELYTDEELEKMAKLAEAGNKSKCRFVYTIHPFMNRGLNDSNYDEGKAAILAKFEQLYEVGVRQFGILADDAGSSTTVQRRILNDAAEWCKSKGDVKDLYFCPQNYYGYANQGGNLTYYQTLTEGLDESVQLFYTGPDIVSNVTNELTQVFREASGRNPVVWLNWPCNDLNDSRLVMGRADVLKEGVTGFDGVITNPMQQAEPSKVAIFAVADYTWNTSAWDVQKNWEDCFKYIEPVAYESLFTMAQNMSDTAPGKFGWTNEESLYIREKLETLQSDLTSGSSVKTSGAAVIAEMDAIINACNDFEQNAATTALREEMDNWTQCLREVATSLKNYILCANALEDGDNEKVWEYYAIAAGNYSQSQTHKERNLGRGQISVQAGEKRIVPVLKAFSAKLAPEVAQIVYPTEELEKYDVSAVIKSADFSGVYSGAESNITDGDDSTSCWYQTSNNTVAANGYIGVDLGSAKEIGSIKVLQGTASSTSDIFTNAVLEYSLDGENYTEIANVTSAETDVNCSITARYVRIRTNANTGKWYAIREFSVYAKSDSAAKSEVAYTNIAKLANTKTTYTEDSDNLQSVAALGEINGTVTLQPGKYIGIALPSIKCVDEVVAQHTIDGAVLEYSMNGVEWTQDAETAAQGARYIRLINKTEQAISGAISAFEVRSNRTFPAKVIENTIGTPETPDYGFDKNILTSATFQGDQKAGRYVIYDLGRVVNVNKLNFVVADTENDYIRHGKVSVAENLPDGSDVVARLLGDVNNDGEINATDATLVLQKYAGILTETDGFDEINADVNADGSIDSTDATLILQDYADISKIEQNATSDGWRDVIVIDSEKNNPDILEIYDHYGASCFKTADNLGGKPVRYVKIEITKDLKNNDSDTALSKWVNFAELEINDNEFVPELDPTFAEEQPVEGSKTPDKIIDGDIESTYLPEIANSSLVYNLSDNKKINAITILQNPLTVSNAVVKVRTGADTWETLGNLSASLNVFDNLDYENILAIKFEWTDVIPEIHEIFFAYENEVITEADKTALRAAYESALEIAENEQFYTADSYAVFKQAYNEASGVIAYPASTQAEVDEAKTKLETAIAQCELLPADNKDELTALINDAKELDENLYTADSWANLQTAISAAELAANDADLTKLDCTKAIEDLSAVIEGLAFNGTTQKVPSDALTGYAPSFHNAQTVEGVAALAVDDNTGSMWHSAWSSSDGVMPTFGENGENNYFIITLDTNRYINKLEYLPRASQTNGNILEYKLYYSKTEDGDDFVEIKGGSGTWENNQSLKTAEFNQVDARRIKIVAVSTAGDGTQANKFITAREFYLYEIVPNN